MGQNEILKPMGAILTYALVWICLTIMVKSITNEKIDEIYNHEDKD